MNQSQKFLAILDAINNNIKLEQGFLGERGISQSELKIIMEELNNGGLINNSSEITVDGVEFLMENERNELLKKIAEK